MVYEYCAPTVVKYTHCHKNCRTKKQLSDHNETWRIGTALSDMQMINKTMQRDRALRNATRGF